MLYIRCSFNLRHPIPPYWLHPQPPQPKIEWSGFCGRFVIRFRRQRGILMAKLRNLNELCEWWGFYGSTLYHSSLACCRQALLIASIHRAPLSKFRLPGVVVGGLGGMGVFEATICQVPSFDRGRARMGSHQVYIYRASLMLHLSILSGSCPQF